METWWDDTLRIEAPACDAALEVMLLLADADARWGDYTSAIRVLDMAARAVGALPLEYQRKRERWSRLHAVAA
jgi:hypothetical protein